MPVDRGDATRRNAMCGEVVVNEMRNKFSVGSAQHT